MQAHLNSAIHAAQTAEGALTLSWTHRRAEWQCSCGSLNFVEREARRSCGLRWRASFALIPAGLPPLGRSAAKAARIGPEILRTLELELQKRKEEHSAKQPLP